MPVNRCNASCVRILIANVHSCRNAGDAALTLVTIRQLQDQFPNCEISLTMDDPNSHIGTGKVYESFFTWVKRERSWRWLNLAWLLPGTLLPMLSFRWLDRPIFLLTPARWQPLMRSYLEADIVVSKPGGFLYSSGRGVSLLIALYTLWLAILARKPVYVYPQSIGPFSRRWECDLTRGLLERARITMAREIVSSQQVGECELGEDQFYLLPDVAFSFEGADEAAAQDWLGEHTQSSSSRRPLLGMTVINWAAQTPGFDHQTDYEEACAAAARRFIEHYNGCVLFFPQVWGPLPAQDDRVASRRVADRLSDLDEAVVVEEPVAPALLKAVYAQMDLFIGTRMHSNIFALSGNVPTLGIAYQPKTRGIMEMVGLDEWAVSIEEVTPSLLVERLDELWLNRKSIRTHLAEIIPDVKARTDVAGELVARDFAEWKATDG